MEIKQNPNFGTHNTSVRKSGWMIKYIAIHYVGATGDADDNIEYYNRPTTTEASADFYVGHKGDVWQYNMDILGRYCWAVGGKKQSIYGATLHGKVCNANSISIEMCVKTKGNETQANHADWYFTKETIDGAVELTKYLMKLYGIPAANVIRHFDVSGKLCPGVVGWNYVSGSEDAWKDFKRKICSGGGSTVVTTTKAKEVDTVKVELPVLKKGCKGDAVKFAQTLLNAAGFDCGKVDGDAGVKFDTATRKYQTAKKLTVDGKWGPQMYGSFFPC